jgi:hypothetical protein
MFEIVSFFVYYGLGTVRAKEMGIDLSELAHLELHLLSPIKVSTKY